MKTPWNVLLSLIIIGHLAVNALFSMFLLCVAGCNYPGGTAITRLHRLEKEAIEPVYVHIDVLTAQTGVSRFTQTNTSWMYSKQENLTIRDPEILKFTHLLVEAKSKYSPNIKPYLKTHDILDSIDSFSHIALNYNVIPPIRIKMKPTIFIMKRKPNIKYDLTKARKRFHLKTTKLDASIKEKSTDDVINETLDSMVPVFDDIVESLEEFGRPLDESLSIDQFKNDINGESELDTIPLETDVRIPSENFSDDFMKDIQVKQERDSPDSSIFVEPEMMDGRIEIDTFDNEIVNISELGMVNDDLIIDNNDGIPIDQSIQSNDAGSKVKETTLKGTFKDDGTNVRRNGKSVKETARKIIQEKMVEIRLKRTAAEEEKGQTNKRNKQNMKGKNLVIEQVVPSQDEKKAKLHVKESQIPVIEYKDKSEKHINVKESIRNIINQFKEFERDYGNESEELFNDVDEFPVEPDVDEFPDEADVDEFPDEADLEASEKHESDRLESIIDHSESKILVDAKRSLKMIIDQFKDLKNLLTSEEDDQFDQIEANYMDRPISETLIQFSDVLKDMIERRKQNYGHASKLRPNYKEKLSDELPNDEKFMLQTPIKESVEANAPEEEYMTIIDKNTPKNNHNTIATDNQKINANSVPTNVQKIGNTISRRTIRANASTKTENNVQKRVEKS